MTWDPGTVTAVIAAIVALAGTAVTYLNRNKDSTDKRLDTLFNANQDLVEDLRTERDGLLRRIVALEEARETVAVQVGQLRETLSEQQMEMYVLRQREADMRVWMSDIMAWAAMAVGIIRGLDREIEDPPSPPTLLIP